jgi:hypothetical protein
VTITKIHLAPCLGAAALVTSFFSGPPLETQLPAYLDVAVNLGSSPAFLVVTPVD